MVMQIYNSSNYYLLLTYIEVVALHLDQKQLQNVIDEQVIAKDEIDILHLNVLKIFDKLSSKYQNKVLRVLLNKKREIEAHQYETLIKYLYEYIRPNLSKDSFEEIDSIVCIFYIGLNRLGIRALKI